MLSTFSAGLSEPFSGRSELFSVLSVMEGCPIKCGSGG